MNIYHEYNKYNKLLIILFICFPIYMQKLYSDKINTLISDTEIILTIKGTNRQQILNTAFNKYPSEILINGNKTDIIDYYVYNLTLEENNITVRFNTTLTSCFKMFSGLLNITKITFNMLDFSGTIMTYMFSGCKNLISLDFNNFNTAYAKDMTSMFEGCKNLVSLDLSNFNTSSLSNVESMFCGCSNLISLDLSHFIISSYIGMNSMFSAEWIKKCP